MEKNYTVGKDISNDLGYSSRNYALKNQKISRKPGKKNDIALALGLGVVAAGSIFGIYSALTRESVPKYSELENAVRSHAVHVSLANPEIGTPFTAYVPSQKMSYLANDLTKRLGDNVSYDPVKNTILVDVDSNNKIDYKDLAIIGNKL